MTNESKNYSEVDITKLTSSDDIVARLRIRAAIRRIAKDRKSVLEGKPDRLCDLLDEAANEIERLRNATKK